MPEEIEALGQLTPIRPDGFELEAVAYQLSSRHIDDLDALRKWLTVLVAPGASLGGARPKANFTEAEGSLWIGKFPARDRDRDIGEWEHVAVVNRDDHLHNHGRSLHIQSTAESSQNQGVLLGAAINFN